MKRLVMVLGVATVLAVVTGRAAEAQFDHERHAQLFPSCDQCHTVPAPAGASVLPQPAICAVCHNGQMQPRVDYAPRVGPSSANLKFTHEAHPPIGCQNCHNQPGSERMQVQRAVVSNCLGCHTVGSSHAEVPDAACNTCHTSVARGGRLHSQGAASLQALPSTHRDQTWRELHGREAAARPDACATCHVRQDCLDCHRPNPADYAGYHPATFLAGHPVAAYARQTSCADCHNTAQFCSDCHRQAGLTTPAGQRLRRGFHDANPGFLAGHGVAARQNLESCVSCHVENDCLACHAALGPARINPHGPGFDGEKLRGKNSQMCALCHGSAIPGEP